MTKKKPAPEGTWINGSDGSRYCMVDECRVEIDRTGVTLKDGTTSLHWNAALGDSYEIKGARWGDGDYWSKASLPAMIFFITTIHAEKSMVA